MMIYQVHITTVRPNNTVINGAAYFKKAVISFLVIFIIALFSWRFI